MNDKGGGDGEWQEGGWDEEGLKKKKKQRKEHEAILRREAVLQKGKEKMDHMAVMDRHISIRRYPLTPMRTRIYPLPNLQKLHSDDEKGASGKP